MSVNKKLAIVLAILVVILIIGYVVYIFIFEGTHRIRIGTPESVAYYGLRLAAAEAKLGHNSAKFTAKEMKTLKSFVQNGFINSQWFSSNYGLFYANTEDTSDQEITWISDGNYTATFYVDKKGNVLRDYKFNNETKKGYKIYVNAESEITDNKTEDSTQTNKSETNVTDLNNNNSISESVSQRNAISKAKSYLSHSAFSYDRLIEQLEYEKFSHDDSVYAVDNCGADWKEQALKKAKSYLSHSAFSYKGLIKQLEYEKFSHEESVYSADNCGANWNEQAVKKAKSYLSHSAFSRDRLIDQLEYEGFTYEQAVYGVEENGL